MGIISIENTDRLFWLGRYTERVYSTLRLFAVSFDQMIDFNPDEYRNLCIDLEIPDIYKDSVDFINRYCFDENDPNSIYSNLIRAYDNAITLREEIGSEPVSYIQLAMYSMNKARYQEAPLIKLQEVLDNLLAFWGIIDDMVDDENVRNIVKIGKRVERIDLYARLHASVKEMEREVARLAGRIDRTNLKYNKETLKHLTEIIREEKIDYHDALISIEAILEV